MGAWTLFENGGVAYGPRLWFETLPFLMLLSARGIDRAADVIARAAHRLRRSSSENAHWAAKAAVYLLVLALVGSSVNGWLLGRHASWRADNVPESAGAMQGAFFEDNRLVSLIEGAHLHQALVLVDPCAPFFFCYMSVFWMNSPTLDGNVVLARNLPEYVDDVYRAYPCREVYAASFDHPSLLRTGFTPAPAGEVCP
jgi:hypothetical protein